MEKDESFQDCLDYFLEEESEQEYQPEYYNKKMIDEDEQDREIPIKWTFANSYSYHTKQLEDIFTNCNISQCLLTQQMKQFQPSEIMLTFDASPPQRLIFYPQNSRFEDFENEKIQEFKDLCRSKGEKIPETDPEILRQLYKKKLNVEQAYQYLKNMQNLQKQLLPFQVTDKVLEIVQSGYSYICGRDRQFRPITVVKPSILFSQMKNYTVEDAVAATSIIQDFCFYHMLKNGSIENIVTIVDVKDLSLWSIDYSKLTQIAKIMGQIAPGKGRCAFLVNTNKSFQAIFNMVSYFIPESTLQKLKVTSQSTSDQMLEIIHPDQLEQKYGGTAKDKTAGQYWPPQFNCYNF